MEQSEKAAAVCATIVIACGAELLKRNDSRKRRDRTIWVKDWLRKRDERGAYNNILNELKLNDSESYRKYIRMSTTTFNENLILTSFLIFQK